MLMGGDSLIVRLPVPSALFSTLPGLSNAYAAAVAYVAPRLHWRRVARLRYVRNAPLQAKEMLKEHTSLRGLPMTVTASMIAGFFASACSLPFDFVKTRIQKMKPDAAGKMPYTGFADCFLKVRLTLPLLRPKLPQCQCQRKTLRPSGGPVCTPLGHLPCLLSGARLACMLVSLCCASLSRPMVPWPRARSSLEGTEAVRTASTSSGCTSEATQGACAKRTVPGSRSPPAHPRRHFCLLARSALCSHAYFGYHTVARPHAHAAVQCLSADSVGC